MPDASMDRMSSRSAGALSVDLLLEAIGALARIAGDTALAHFRSPLAVETKGDGSPVTIADREAEHAVRAWVESHFPDDGVLGEELGAVREGAPLRWIVDPIDGTKSFVRGVPLWGSLVALAQGERVLAGAAYFPPVSELLVAAPGAGCWRNGARTSVSDVSDFAASTVLTTDERFADRPDRLTGWRALSARASVSRTWGDCYGYLLVATGRAEAMIDPILSPWDAAALQPIIAEAGGVFTCWDGVETAFGGSAVATNFVLAEAVRHVLAAPAC